MPAPPSATADEIRDVNARYHDGAAAGYDAKWGIDYGEVGQAQVLGKARKALGASGRFPTFGRSLEIGAGTGYFTLNLLQAGVVREAVCTDISPGMLRVLEDNARTLSVTVETRACDAEDLPFGDAEFDLVVGHAVLHHLPDLPRAFAGFRRVLPPGGTVVFAGEPSRYGDRLANVPKRAAAAVAPLWRTLMRAGPATGGHDDGGAAHHGVEARPPAARPTTSWRATSTSTRSRRTRSNGPRAKPASPTSACAARSCSPTGSAGPTARSRRTPTPTRARGRGRSTRSAATWPCRRSTARCSSRACRRRSSTTSCCPHGRQTHQRPRTEEGRRRLPPRADPLERVEDVVVVGRGAVHAALERVRRPGRGEVGDDEVVRTEALAVDAPVALERRVQILAAGARGGRLVDEPLGALERPAAADAPQRVARQRRVADE